MLEPICTILAWLCCSTREVTTIASWLFSGLTHWEGRLYIPRPIYSRSSCVWKLAAPWLTALTDNSKKAQLWNASYYYFEEDMMRCWKPCIWVGICASFFLCLRDGITISKNVFESSTMRLMVGVGWGAFGELNADRFLLCCVSPRAFA